MKITTGPLWILLILILFLPACKQSGLAGSEPIHPLQNREPLRAKQFLELPLGSVKPEGWILQQLQLMKTGMTGHLDEWYPSVVGERNGWLGGDGDGWERGP